MKRRSVEETCVRFISENFVSELTPRNVFMVLSASGVIKTIQLPVLPFDDVMQFDISILLSFKSEL
jgi:hypothetical protein